MSRTIPLPEKNAIGEAARLLGAGRLVAVPTETVYGLAADATNGTAVASIYAAKGRPSFNPLIVHVDSVRMAEEHAEFGPLAHLLAERFWPGPLTLVLPARPDSTVHPLVRAGLATVAIRMPEGVARDIIARLGRPLAAPSANRSGGVSPTAAEHVVHSLGGRVDLVLDAGRTRVGVESTILRPAGDRIVLLRPGGISRREIESVSGLPVAGPSDGAPIEAPGQMTSHYAPHGRVRLDATSVSPDEWLIRFGEAPVAGEERAAGVRQLSRTGDVMEAAASIFSILADLDRPEVERIAVMPVPSEGLGEAVNDRLRRAAAPRNPAGVETGEDERTYG